MHKATPRAAKAAPSPAHGLIGPAADIASRLITHTRTLRDKPGAILRMLFHGRPGTGKTTLANLIASQLAANAIEIESINGRKLTIDVVKDWQDSIRYGSLFGGWKVKLINEVDLVPHMAQDLMLTYLDELPERTAVLATSNASTETLTDRFASRFGQVHVAAPSDELIAEHLRANFALGKEAAHMLAAGACGNVRDAELQAEAHSILGDHARHAERPALKIICASKSESAKRAWETMRAKNVAA